MLSQMSRLLFLLMYVYTHTGEGNGNPLQYSRLESPVDRGAWRAAVHGVTQSWTRLKRLSMHAQDITKVQYNFLCSAYRTGKGQFSLQSQRKAMPKNPQITAQWYSSHTLSDFTFTFHFHALEKEMATHSSVLAWRIPEMGEPGGLPSMGSPRVGHDWSDLAAAAHASKVMLKILQARD